jgi:hypothetical protein
MDNDSLGMTYKEKSAFASSGLPDPRFSNSEPTEVPIRSTIRRTRSVKKRKLQRKRKSTLKSRKVR